MKPDYCKSLRVKITSDDCVNCPSRDDCPQPIVDVKWLKIGLMSIGLFWAVVVWMVAKLLITYLFN